MDLDGSPRPREPQRSDVNATQQQQQRLSASRAVSPAAERPLSPVLMSPSPRGGGGRHRGESPSVGRCSSMPQPPVVMCDRALVWQPSPLQAASARIHHHHHRPPTAPGRSVSAPRSQSHRQDASSRQQQRSRTPGRTNLRPPTAPRPTTSSKSAARKDDGTHRSHHVSIKEDRRTATAAAATTAPHSPSPKMDRKPDRAAVSPCGHAAAERRGTNCFQGDASNVQATSWQQQRPPRRRKEVKDAPPLGSNTNNKTVDSRPQNTAAQAISSSGGINSNSNNGWNGNPLTSSHNLVTADITFRGVNDTPPPSSSSNRLQHQGRRMSFLSGNNNIQLSLTETTGDIDVESILQTTGASGGPHILATSQFEENVGKAILRKDAARVGALLKLYGKLLSNQRHPLPEDGDPLQEEMGSGNVLDVTPLSRKCILLNDCESEFAASDSRGLLDRVVDPETGYTLMHLAVLTMDKRIVHECLRHGSEVHAIADVQGDTPLTLAMRRYPSCVQVLFTLGKNINVKRPVGFQQRELDVLLSQNSVPAAAADASAVVGDGAQNLLHCAVAADHRTPKWPGRLKFMELLVERYGLSASQEDMHGFTPILWAHEHERFLGPKETTAIVKYLKKAVRKEQRGHTSAAAAATPQAAAAVVAVSGERMDVLYKLTGLRRTSHNFMPPTHSSGVSPAPPHHHHRRRQLRVHSPPITRPSGATANGRLGAPSPPPLCPRSDRSPSAQASRHAVSAQSVVMGATSIGHEPSLGTVCGTPVSSSRLRVSRSPSPQVVVVEVAPTPSASRPRTQQQQQRGYSAARGVSESCRPSLAHRAASQSVAAVLRGLEEAAPCSADVPRMTLFVARADRIRYRLQGPLARLLCVLLLFPLHALCYGLDVSTQWSGETRFDVWWRALNMIFSGWNGSAFVMGITHVLCAAAGLIGGYAFFVYVIGELVCCRALRLPMFGAQSTGERRYMRKELGLYYETFYNASRRPRLFLAVVGVLCGLAASAAVYNALIDTWWGGQASWAVITPVFSFMHPESCLLLLCALSLGLDVLLLCGLVDVMYQQGALSVYLPHYRFSQLADWVDLSATPWLQRHGLLRLPRLKLVLPEPWRTRYNSSTQSDHYYSVEGNLRRRSGGDKSEPPPASGDTIVVDGTRGGTCTPRLTLRPTLSLQRFRIWAFWTCCAMGWSVVFIAIVIAGTQRTARRHRTPTAAAAAADESAMVGRAVCCVLFASCALVLSVLIALQAWTWPTFQPHPHLAVPGLSATGSGAHLGWVLWLLLFGLASMDVRNAAENTRVVMQEGNAGQKAAVVLVLLPACMACMAQCAAVLSTSMRLRQQSPLGPSSIVDRRRDAPPPLRAWLAGTHLQLKPVPVTFGLLHSAEPDLPQWQAFLLASHGDGLQTEAALKEASPLPPPHTDSTVIECDDVDGKQNDDDNDDDVDGLLLKADDAERAVVELVEYMDAHDMLSGVHRRRASCRDKDTNNNNNNNNKATSNFSSSSSSCSSSSSSSSSNTSAASSSSSSCGTANQGGEANSECPTSRQNDDNNNNAMAMTGPEEGDRLYERLRRILWLREQHRRSCVARCRGEVLAYAGATAAVRRKRFDVRERERMYLSVLQTKGTTTKR